MASDRSQNLDPATAPDVSETTIAALHELELGLEALQRAQGHLIEFHHAVGRGMDHLDLAASLLRECDEADYADELCEECLPLGVVDDHRWSYEVLEHYQEGFLDEVQSFEERVRMDLADGTRHVAERRQEREWKARAGLDPDEP